MGRRGHCTARGDVGRARGGRLHHPTSRRSRRRPRDLRATAREPLSGGRREQGEGRKVQTPMSSPFPPLRNPSRGRRLRFLLLSPFSFLPVFFSLLQGGEAAPAPAPAVNWVLPIFTDKEGYRSMTLRGTEV